MSGANLDGYSYPREGIHKQEMQKRIDVLEDEVSGLKELMYELIEKIVNEGDGYDDGK